MKKLPSSTVYTTPPKPAWIAMSAWVFPIALLLAGCSNQTSHVPPLWQWPVLAVENTVGNHIYNQRRAKVKSYIANNLTAFLEELSTFSTMSQTTHIAHTSNLADVAKNKEQTLYQALLQDKKLIEQKEQEEGADAQIEMLTVIFMVHGK